MAAKTFKTSKAPTSSIKGGLDPIIAGSIYISKPKRERKRKHGIHQIGGATTVRNQLTVKNFTVRLDADTVHHGQIKATTVIKDTSSLNFTAKVFGEKVILGDKSTYTPQMKAHRDEPVVREHKVSDKHKPKVSNKGSRGYMESHRKNGRRIQRSSANVSQNDMMKRMAESDHDFTCVNRGKYAPNEYARPEDRKGGVQNESED